MSETTRTQHTALAKRDRSMTATCSDLPESAVAHEFPAKPNAALTRLLDKTYDRLLSNRDVCGAVNDLVSGLGELWQVSDHTLWATVVADCRRHALYELLGEDPFTDRARTKPRGYAGDAVMIDFIYNGLPATDNVTTPIGREIFAYTAGCSRSACAVRDRRDLIAARVDGVAERTKRPRILSLACGHLREARQSRALVRGAIGEFWALDQDSESLDVARSDYSDIAELKVIACSVRDLLKGSVRIEGFDFIYAAGLYDYLPESVGTSLTKTLMEGLTSGGRLLIGNFLRAPTSVGYMEAMMDWSLVWRSEEELAALVRGIDPTRIASMERFVDAHETVAYLEIERR